jgi:hypothetical protein
MMKSKWIEKLLNLSEMELAKASGADDVYDKVKYIGRAEAYTELAKLMLSVEKRRALKGLN